MDEALQKRFAQVGSQEGKSDPLVIAKYFNPCGAGTWLATEYDPERREFFGYVSIFGDHCDEWGYFSLIDLESIHHHWWIERDLDWEEKPATKAIPDFTGFGR
jgi:hypothetical protein